MAEHGEQAVVVGNSRAEASAAGEEAGEEGDDSEEKGEDEEDPAKAPQVVVLGRGGVTAVAAHDGIGDAFSVGIPGVAEGVGSHGLVAISVALATDVEVGPLGHSTGAASTGDALGVGLEEVRLVERRGVGDTSQDDEEEHGERAGHEDQAGKTKHWAYKTYTVSILFAGATGFTAVATAPV